MKTAQDNCQNCGAPFDERGCAYCGTRLSTKPVEMHKIKGDGQNLTISFAIIKGDGNIICGNNNIVKGDGNKITGDNNEVKGDGNILKGKGNIAKGDGNITRP